MFLKSNVGNRKRIEARSSANDNSAYMCSANDKSALYRYKTASIDYSRICNRKRISEKSRRLEIQYCRRSTESYPEFARIGLRENPGKNLNQVTCPDRDSNPGHLVSRPDVLTVTPQYLGGRVENLNSQQYNIEMHGLKLERTSRPGLIRTTYVGEIMATGASHELKNKDVPPSAMAIEELRETTA
ncbi:hypothetical protein ANN_02498 [Periplaneta americana]|uniref:Uncharacterized protein n=1 Tax=Periplaneta americana TaxID=6978 RepID=A0ABQ8TWG1_PERAM|nr:hypothetical protein ANN_02498 [Periplaneta americana]